MVIFKYVNRVLLVLAFFTSLIPYGYRVYEDKSGWYKYGEMNNLNPENPKKSAQEKIYSLKFCDNVYVDRMFEWDPFTYRISCSRSFGQVLFVSLFWFIIPFIFVLMFGSAFGWAISTKKKAH